MDESLAVTLQTTMTQLWAPVANIFNIFKLCGVLRDVCFTTYLSSFDANTCQSDFMGAVLGYERESMVQVRSALLTMWQREFCGNFMLKGFIH